MHTYAFALLYAAVAYVVYRVINARLEARAFAREEVRRGCKPPPTVPNRWVLGLDHIYGALKADAKNKFPEYVDQRFEFMNYKTHRFNILDGSGISTVDPKNIQAILATQFNDFALGDRRRLNFFPLLGNGIFTADGKSWEHSRAMLRPQFAREQVSDLYLEERHVQNLMKALPAGEGGWTNETDLSLLFFRLTIDSACEFLFGESVESQLLNVPQYAADSGAAPRNTNNEKSFTYAFDNAQRMIATRSRFQNMFWLIDSLEFRRNIKTVHAFIDEFVAKALAKQRQEKQQPAGVEAGDKKPKYVFLDALAQQTQDPIELRSQLLNILLAGRDTTAGLLGWTFWELARKPEVFAKLRAAVVAEFGEYDGFSVADDISFSKLKACQYVQWVLHETLRVHTVVPFNFRVVAKEYATLPRGGGDDGMSPILLRKGESIEYTINVMHRMKQHWGDDAEEYRPDRWAGRKPGWEFLPFNGGPRICIGQQFALTEASYVLVRLMQRFDGIQNLDFDDITHNLTLTSSPGGGVRVRLHQAPNVA